MTQELFESSYLEEFWVTAQRAAATGVVESYGGVCVVELVPVVYFGTSAWGCFQSDGGLAGGSGREILCLG